MTKQLSLWNWSPFPSYMNTAIVSNFCHSKYVKLLYQSQGSFYNDHLVTPSFWCWCNYSRFKSYIYYWPHILLSATISYISIILLFQPHKCSISNPVFRFIYNFLSFFTRTSTYCSKSKVFYFVPLANEKVKPLKKKKNSTFNREQIFFLFLKLKISPQPFTFKSLVFLRSLLW